MKLMTMAEVDEARRGKRLLKGASRLQEAIDAETLTVVDAKAFKLEIRTRDRYHCRMCLRAVIVTLSRVPERAECHHIHGKQGDLRYETRCALLLCLECHEKVTGRVNERWIVVATKTFTMPTMPGRDFCDAREPVQFERVA